MRLCRCGEIVQSKCSRCDKRQQESTTDRGYDGQWKALSERYRASNPLCEVCEIQGRTKAADHVHHIVPVSVDPGRRLDVTNLIAVCERCHVEVEGKDDPRKDEYTHI
jgi:5-methylcytosine-specific restriction protein A